MFTLLVLFFIAALCSCTCFAQKNVGAVTLGYEYLNAQGKTGARNGFQGWHAELEYNLAKKWGVFADSGNFYAAGANVHGFTGGLLYKFAKFGRLTPNAFTEFGESRTSDAGMIGHAFEYVIGGGVAVKLNKHVSLDLVPGEYAPTWPKGDLRNNYVAEVGLTFPFGHK